MKRRRGEDKAPARRPRAAAPDSAPPCTRRRARTKPATSDLELLERRPRVDDVALELQLRLLEPGGDAHELRQVEDRQAELPPGRRLELLLPGIQREMAQGTRRHHHVRPGLHRLLDRLDQLAHRGLLARLDDREAAALDLRGIVDRLAAARLDD